MARAPVDPIASAAELAELARRCARRERELALMQGPDSRWREIFTRAADLHMRAAELHTDAVSHLLMLRTLREDLEESMVRLAAASPELSRESARHRVR